MARYDSITENKYRNARRYLKSYLRGRGDLKSYSQDLSEIRFRDVPLDRFTRGELTTIITLMSGAAGQPEPQPKPESEPEPQIERLEVVGACSGLPGTEDVERISESPLLKIGDTVVTSFGGWDQQHLGIVGTRSGRPEVFIVAKSDGTCTPLHESWLSKVPPEPKFRVGYRVLSTAPNRTMGCLGTITQILKAGQKYSVRFPNEGVRAILHEEHLEQYLGPFVNRDDQVLIHTNREELKGRIGRVTFVYDSPPGTPGDCMVWVPELGRPFRFAAHDLTVPESEDSRAETT